MTFKRIILGCLLLAGSVAFGQDSAELPSPISEEPNWQSSPAGPIRRLPPVVEDPNFLPVSDSEITTSPSSPPEEDRKNRPGMPGMFDKNRSPISYRATWFPAVHVSGQDANFAMVDQNLSVMAPLGMPSAEEKSPLDRPTGGWFVSANVRNQSIATEAILPDTGAAYPNELWNVSAGLNYFRKLDNDWFLGGGVNLGSASDRPFASIDEMFVSVMAFLRIPSGERNAWMFSVFYAPMSELRFPIPMAAYQYAPSDSFRMNIGLPLSFTYRPIERVTLEASYMPIHTIHAKAKYEMADWLGAFIAYDWSNQSYALADRTDLEQRFYLYDQRLAAGLESTFARHYFAELSAGLIFDRYSFEGRQWDTTQFNRVTFGNGPFASLQGGLKF
jgi:hypothetical protein